MKITPQFWKTAFKRFQINVFDIFLQTEWPRRREEYSYIISKYWSSVVFTVQKLRGKNSFLKGKNLTRVDIWTLMMTNKFSRAFFLKCKVMYSYKHNNKSFNKPFTNSIIYTLSMYKYFFQMTNLPPEF